MQTSPLQEAIRRITCFSLDIGGLCDRFLNHSSFDFIAPLVRVEVPLDSLIGISLSRLSWLRPLSCPPPGLCKCGKAVRLSIFTQAVFADTVLVMPGLSLLHVRELGAHALVVVRVEPEHTGEHFLCLPQAAEAPHAEAVAVEAPEEGAVLGKPPGKETTEVLAEGELPDFTPMS